MRWLLRTAVAVAGLGSVATTALAQPESPPPMMPPVRALPDDEPPATGFTTGLPALPSAPVAAPVTPAAAWVPAASAPKPPPPVTEQVGIPANRDDEKPDRLPPLQSEPPTKPPAKPALPAPPSTGPLPTIPLAPVAPPPTTKPVGPAPKPAAPVFFPPGTAPLKPLTPPVSTPAPAKPQTAAPVPPVPAKPDAPKTLPPVTAPPAACPTARVAEVVCDPVWRLAPQDAPVRVRGWLDGGYVYNTSNPASKFNGPYNSVDRSAEPMFNQAYVTVERPLPTSGAIGAGFRVDALFGYDHYLGQSRGFEADRDFNQRWNGQYYGLALPQAYAELGSDVWGLKLGHFYSPVGYESLAAQGNFFYSHAYSYQFGQPFTHWGGVLTTQLTRNVQAQAGLVNGWDALVGRANNVNFLGGIKYTPDSNGWWASLALVTGQEQNNPAGRPNVPGTDGNRTRYSFLIGLTPGGPSGRWEYVFHHYYGWQENGTPQGNFARWYGIDQYLYYRVSRTVKLGGRVEWFRDEDGTRVGLNRPSNPNNPPLPGNYFALTGGVNYSPTANFRVRPEVRWDFTSDTARPAFNDGKKNNQLILGCDLIWQF